MGGEPPWFDYSKVGYWADQEDYAKLLQDHKTVLGLGAAATATPPPAILVAGTFYVTGSVSLDEWYILPEAQLSTLSPGPYSFEYQDESGAVLNQQAFDVSSNVRGTILTEVPFAFTIPYITGTTKIIVKKEGVPLGQKVKTSSTPTVKVISPNGGERLTGQVSIQWSASYADGDALSHVILTSRDNGATWEPVATGISGTNYTLDTSGLPPGTQYSVKVIATDGFNTGEDTSDAIFAVLGKTFLPIATKNWRIASE